MFWAFIGTLYLAYLTYEDYRKGMTIDDRKNYFMMGMSFALYGIFKRQWWYVLALIFIVLVFGFIMHKSKIMGGGDINTFLWIIYGFGIIAPNAVLTWAIIFIILLILYEVAKRVFFKQKNPLPFFGVILISFVASCGILGLYL